MPGYLRENAVYYAGPAKTPAGYAPVVRPDHRRAHGRLRRPVPEGGRFDGDAGQGKPLSGRDRRLPGQRRLLPRLDRWAGRTPGQGQHPLGRGPGLPRARDGRRSGASRSRTSRRSSSWTTRATTSSPRRPSRRSRLFRWGRRPSTSGASARTTRRCQGDPEPPSTNFAPTLIWIAGLFMYGPRSKSPRGSTRLTRSAGCRGSGRSGCSPGSANRSPWPRSPTGRTSARNPSHTSARCRPRRSALSGQRQPPPDDACDKSAAGVRPFDECAGSGFEPGECIRGSSSRWDSWRSRRGSGLQPRARGDDRAGVASVRARRAG